MVTCSNIFTQAKGKCGDNFGERSKRMEKVMTTAHMRDWQQGCITAIEMNKKRGGAVCASSGRGPLKCLPYRDEEERWCSVYV